MDRGKAQQILAEAIFVTELSNNKKALFLQALHTGLKIADRHPEVVGILIESLEITANDIAMPADLVQAVEDRADRIALATADPSETVATRLERLI